MEFNPSPCDDVPGQLQSCQTQQAGGPPVFSGGGLVQVLLEVGEFGRAAEVLHKGLSRALEKSETEQTIACHLWSARMMQLQNDPLAAGNFLEKARFFASRSEVHPSLVLLQSVVGTQVSLGLGDLLSAETYLEPLRALAEAEAPSLLRKHLRLWEIELQIRKGKHERIGELRQDDFAGETESAWMAHDLAGFAAMRRGDRKEAEQRLTQAARLIRAIADRLPGPVRKGYRESPARAAVFQRLEEVAGDAQSDRSVVPRPPPLPTVAADAETAEPVIGPLSKRGEVVLSMLARILEVGLELESVLRTTLAVMAQATQAERGFILLLDGEESQKYRFVLNVEHAEVEPSKVPVSFGAVLRACESNRPVLVEEVEKDSMVRDRESVMALGLKSILAVPLALRSEHQGVVYLDVRTGPRRFTQEDLSLVWAFARQLSPILSDARLLRDREERLLHLEEVVRRGQAELQKRYKYTEIVGDSAAMRRVFTSLDSAVASDYPVLIEGETGTGKELFAKAIHYNGERKDHPFVAVNCGSLAEGVLESELFGHEKGAFTGAHRSRKGLFQVAHGGSLFLDEVEAMSPAMQTKLLRVVEEGVVRPVGGTVQTPFDVRLLAATNRDLLKLIAEKSFRSDLYYRLNVLHLSVPPLRQRTEDLQALAEHLLQKIARETKQERGSLHPDCLRLLQAHSWPGNVRELENVLRRARALAPGELLPEHLPEHLRDPSREWGATLQERIRRMERENIIATLGACEGNISRAAQLLGMKRPTLQRRMDEYGIRRPRALKRRRDEGAGDAD